MSTMEQWSRPLLREECVMDIDVVRVLYLVPNKCDHVILSSMFAADNECMIIAHSHCLLVSAMGTYYMKCDRHGGWV